MAEEEEWDVLEGFLCPICMKDLKSINQLQSHFDDEHGTEDKVVLQSIKGFLNKAKKIILKDEDLDMGFSSKILKALPDQASLKESNNSWNWTSVVADQGRSHLSMFRKVRSARIDSHVAETNKLIIRLDKLLSNIPSDPTKRKAHERSVVIWAENKDVPLCPYCATFFNIAKRRHHCRLCGAVMCDDCSQNLSFSFAEKLIYPIHQGKKTSKTVTNTTTEKKLSSTLGSLVGTFSPLKRTNSHGSLNSLLSVVDSMNKEKSFRCCQDCMRRLETRDRQTIQREATPILSLYYGKLMEQRTQLSDYLPKYQKMSKALNNGEGSYTLSDAMDLRLRMLRLSDEMSIYAQKIRDLGKSGVEHVTDPSKEDTEPCPAGARQTVLQRRIHSTTLSFLKENILSLNKLPDSEEYARKVIQRRDESASRESRGNISTKESSSRSSSSQSKKVNPKELNSTDVRKKAEVLLDDGWSGDISAHSITETDDPMIQQMNIIRSYIKQARQAKRFEEIELLENNLRELQKEFKRQRRSEV